MKIFGLVGLAALVSTMPNPAPSHSANKGSALAKREFGPIPASPQPANSQVLQKRSPAPISTQPVNGNRNFQKRSPAPASSKPRNTPNLHKRCGGWGGYGCWSPRDWGCGGPWGYGIGYGAGYGLGGFGYY